ncbi:MAG: hypothetical protein V4587_09170 [Acidobacteriota bacterium]
MVLLTITQSGAYVNYSLLQMRAGDRRRVWLPPSLQNGEADCAVLAIARLAIEGRKRDKLSKREQLDPINPDWVALWIEP